MLLTAATEAVTEVATEVAHAAECTCRYYRQNSGNSIVVDIFGIIIILSIPFIWVHLDRKSY